MLRFSSAEKKQVAISAEDLGEFLIATIRDAAMKSVKTVEHQYDTERNHSHLRMPTEKPSFEKNLRAAFMAEARVMSLLKSHQAMDELIEFINESRGNFAFDVILAGKIQKYIRPILRDGDEDAVLLTILSAQQERVTNFGYWEGITKENCDDYPALEKLFKENYHQLKSIKETQGNPRATLQDRKKPTF